MNELQTCTAELPHGSQPVACIGSQGVPSRQAVAFRLRGSFESVYNLAGGTEAGSMEVDPAVPRH